MLRVASILFACLVIVGANAPPAKADVILKDHTMSWVNGGDLILHAYAFPGSSQNAGSSVMFQANGGILSTIGIVWAHAGSGGVPNGGNPGQWNWRFRFWESTGDYILDPMGENPSQPNYAHIFDTPSNPDWFTQIGMSGAYNMYYAEVDVGFLNIQLPSDGLVHAMLHPAPGGGGGAGLLAFSDGFGAFGHQDDWFKSQLMGPDTLHNLGAPYDWSAYRVTVIPAPAGICVLGAAGLLGLKRRRRSNCDAFSRPHASVVGTPVQLHSR